MQKGKDEQKPAPIGSRGTLATPNERIANEATARIMFNREMMGNAHLLRSELMTSMMNVGKDINQECGYPDVITNENYTIMHKREGLAKRVCNVLPEESWVQAPVISEKEEGNTDSEFDKAWDELEKKHHLFHYLERTDMLSGIGRFGILLLGIGDGKQLIEPVEGINELTGEKVGKSEHKLLFVRPFQEEVVTIDRTEANVSSPRYGQPVIYGIKFQDQTSTATTTQAQQSAKVHWTRVIHIADNREMSDTFGAPRMEGTYNRLLDIRKVLSGSGEMFWKGAFPGYSFEINPEIAADAGNIDEDSIKEKFALYSSGLQRYLALSGVTAKSLAPQVADPSKHIETQIKVIAMSLGVPWRILVGSEAAQLASGQDKQTMNDRTGKRRENYLTPLVVRPLVDRFMLLGILPETKEYFVMWPDLNTPTDQQKAEVAGKKTEAMAKYVAGSVDELIPPMEFLTMVMGFSKDEAQVIEDAAAERQKEIDEDEEEQSEAEKAAVLAETQRREQDAKNGNNEPGGPPSE